jgi:hypothetical protein
MDKSEAASISVSGILLGIGGVMLSIVFPLAAAVDPPALTAWWFLALSSIGGALALVGTYMVVAVYAGCWLPATARERAFRPRLQDAEAHVLRLDENDAVFRIALYNAGRGNVDGALLNVVVPDFITELHRCSETGVTGLEEHKGAYSSTPEALLEDDPDVGSIYWNGNVSFPGRMHRLIFFRATLTSLRDFPVRLEITAPELETPFNKRFHLSLPTVAP